MNEEFQVRRAELIVSHLLFVQLLKAFTPEDYQDFKCLSELSNANLDIDKQTKLFATCVAALEV